MGAGGGYMGWGVVQRHVVGHSGFEGQRWCNEGLGTQTFKQIHCIVSYGCPVPYLTIPLLMALGCFQIYTCAITSNSVMNNLCIRFVCQVGAHSLGPGCLCSKPNSATSQLCVLGQVIFSGQRFPHLYNEVDRPTSQGGHEIKSSYMLSTSEILGIQ